MSNLSKRFMQFLTDAKTYDAVFFHEILIIIRKKYLCLISAQIVPDRKLFKNNFPRFRKCTIKTNIISFTSSAGDHYNLQFAGLEPLNDYAGKPFSNLPAPVTLLWLVFGLVGWLVAGENFVNKT